MYESLATILVGATATYLAIGFAFAIAFVIRGVGRIDPAAREGSLGFRLLILPGCAALWPILARNWLRRSPPPEERNAHRAAAQDGDTP